MSVHLTRTSAWFDNVEKVAETMNRDLSNLHSKMDLQMNRLEDIEKNMVEYHQKSNHMSKWNIKAIERQDNVSIAKIDKKLENLAGDMEELKKHVSNIMSKIDKIGNKPGQQEGVKAA